MLEAPELNTVLQVWSYRSRIEGENHFPQPAGLDSFDVAQDALCFLDCSLCGHPLFGPELVSHLISLFFLVFLSLHSVYVSFCPQSLLASIHPNSPMFLVMPASFSFLFFFLPFLILVYLTCSSGLRFCSIPISFFSVPYFSYCIPSSFPVQSSSLLSLSSEELQTIPPSLCFLSLFCDILFGIFSFSQIMNLTWILGLPLAVHVFHLIILLTHGIAFSFLSHTNILSYTHLA